jgi:hypothetical protein
VGRPVLFHGPTYASPGSFLQENDAGFCCYSLDSNEIVKCLEKVVEDQEYYVTVSANGKKAFEKYLTLHSMRKGFAEFLQLDEEFLVPLEHIVTSRDS